MNFIKQWDYLLERHKLGNLAHAYIFSGEKGIGKKEFALEFIKFLNCKFPDFQIVKKLDDKTEIEIFQIREAEIFLNYKAYNGGWKVLIIENAELMNIEAQNCFLKTLEEPKEKTLLLLISSKPDLLLSTIYSRCQELKFLNHKGLTDGQEIRKEEKEILDNFIAIVGGTLADKFKYTKSFNFSVSEDEVRQNPAEIIEVIQKYFRLLLLNEIGVGTFKVVSKKKYSIQQLKNILYVIDEVYNKLIFTNVNPKLALEALLLEI